MVTPTSSVIFLFKTRVFQTFCEKTIPHSEATGYNPFTNRGANKHILHCALSAMEDLSASVSECQNYTATADGYEPEQTFAIIEL